MSYDITITHPETGEPLHTYQPHHIYGCTYNPEDTELRLGISCNYAPFFYRADTLGESTQVNGDKPINGALPILHEEYGGIPGLAYLTLPKARLRVLKAINALRDEPLDKDGNPYKGDPELPASNYWAPTERNARRALRNLLHLLCLAPDNAKIRID